jgi:hypothetical protein
MGSSPASLRDPKIEKGYAAWWMGRRENCNVGPGAGQVMSGPEAHSAMVSGGGNVQGPGRD